MTSNTDQLEKIFPYSLTSHSKTSAWKHNMASRTGLFPVFPHPANSSTRTEKRKTLGGEPRYSHIRSKVKRTIDQSVNKNTNCHSSLKTRELVDRLHPVLRNVQRPVCKARSKSFVRSKPQSTAKHDKDLPLAMKGILKQKQDVNQPVEPESYEERHVQFRSKASDQLSLRRKLEDWLIRKGKTPSKCRNLINFGTHLSERKKKAVEKPPSGSVHVKKQLFSAPVQKSNSDSQLHSVNASAGKENYNFSLAKKPITDLQADCLTQDQVFESLKTMLDELYNLYRNGCPLEQTLSWLDEMDKQIPNSSSFAPYYVCKAKIFASDPQKVLHILCEAISNSAEPKELIVEAMHRLLGPCLKNPFYFPPLLEEDNPLMRENVLAYERPNENTYNAALHNPNVPEEETVDDLAVSEVSEVSSADDGNTGPSAVMVIVPSGASADAGVDRKKQICYQASTVGSTVKFTVTEGSPLISDETTPEVKCVVTPVRRANRLSGRQSTPGVMREITSLTDLTPSEKNKMVFRKNSALYSTFG